MKLYIVLYADNNCAEVYCGAFSTIELAKAFITRNPMQHNYSVNEVTLDVPNVIKFIH